MDSIIYIDCDIPDSMTLDEWRDSHTLPHKRSVKCRVKHWLVTHINHSTLLERLVR